MSAAVNFNNVNHLNQLLTVFSLKVTSSERFITGEMTVIQAKLKTNVCTRYGRFSSYKAIA